MIPRGPATIDALSLLKDWSTTLAFIDTGILTAIGAVVFTGRPRAHDWRLVVSFLFLLASLIIALHLLGSLPVLAEVIAASSGALPSIYFLRNVARVPVWWMALGQHATLLVALGFLSAYLGRVRRLSARPPGDVAEPSA